MMVESCNVKQEVGQFDGLPESLSIEIMQVETEESVEYIVEPVNVVFFGERCVLEEADIGAAGGGSVLSVTKEMEQPCWKEDEFG